MSPEIGRQAACTFPLIEAYGSSEEDIATGTVDARWQAFLAFQIERIRKLYAEAADGIAMLNADGRFAITAASELYQAILIDIEDHDGDVVSRRAYVSSWGKIRRLLGIWWRFRAGIK